jgi:hypothetical protein
MKTNLKNFTKACSLAMLTVINSFVAVHAQTYYQNSGNVTQSGKTYQSSTNDVSAVKVAGGTFNLSTSSVSSTGNTTSSDSSSFYGLNAVMLATINNGTAVINSSNNTITSSGSGANGIYAYGAATIISSSDVLTQTGGGAHAIMCAGGGTITVTNDTAVTSGGSSSTIATDRGGGTITVTGGTYTSGGSNSAAIYSTGNITCNNATLTANGAESMVIEGANYIFLNNCSVNANFNKWGSMIYQSMSGDASGTLGYLTMTGGSFTYTGTAGGMFYNTNSTAIITLDSVTLINSCDTLIRCIKGSWGQGSADSGGLTHLTAKHQIMSGLIHADIYSKLFITLQTSSAFTGAINHSNTAKSVTLTMDCNSTWTVTSTSYINGLITDPCISGTSVSNITGNGNDVFYTPSTNPGLGGLIYNLVNGGYLVPVGTNGVNEINSMAMITEFLNFPDPFNNTTTVFFDLHLKSDIELSLLDMTGKIIEKIYKNDLPSGKNEIELSTGDKFQSGEYVLQLKASNTCGTFVLTKRVIKL